MAPSFSVIIAAYQAAQSIGDAVESVLTQTIPAREIVICDDGSTDDIARALEPYRSEIMLLHQENKGEAAAKNAAAAAATGDFVVILDADDFFLPHYLEAVGELAAERPDLDILTTNAYLDVDGRVIGRHYPDVAKFVIGDQRLGAMHNHFIFGLAAIRRTRYFSIGGFDETIKNPDTDFFLRAILAGARAGLVDAPLAVRRIREGSLSADPAANMQAEVVILERAGTHPSLTPAESSYLEAQLEAKRRAALLAGAEAAVVGGAPDARRRAVAVALGPLPPGFGARTRLKSLAAAAFPRTAAHFLRRRAAKGGISLLRRVPTRS